MVIARKILTTSAILFFASSAYAQNFEAFVDSGDIAVGQNINVKLELTGANPQGVPDLSSLPAGLKIAGQSQQSSIEIVNGHQTSSISWIYNIIPSKEGTYNIPEMQISTEVGTLFTRPFKIFVKDAGSLPQTTQDNAVFIEAELNKETVFVGEPTIYTVRIFSRYQLNDADLKKPVSEGLVFDQIGEPKISNQIFNGENYNLVTVNFLVTPTKTGRNSIGSSVLKGRIALPNKQAGGQVGIANGMADPFFDNGLAQLSVTPFTIASKSISLIVKEPVKGVETWLPAKRVDAKDEITGATDGQIFTAKAGEPFTRKIYLSSEGRFGKSLPDIEKLVQNENFKIYADKPVENGEVSQEAGRFILTGKKSQTFSYIPQKAGDFDLPEIKINWWNTETNSLENAIIPARKITVAGNDTIKPEEAKAEEATTAAQPAAKDAAAAPINSTDNQIEKPLENKVDSKQEPAQKNAAETPQNINFDFEQILMWLTGIAVFILVALKILSNKPKQKTEEPSLLRRELRTNKPSEKMQFFSSDVDSFFNLNSALEIDSFIKNFAEKKLAMPKNSNVIAIAENLVKNYNFDNNLVEAAKQLDANIFAGKQADLGYIKQAFSTVFKSELKSEKPENKKPEFDKLNPF